MTTKQSAARKYVVKLRDEERVRLSMIVADHGEWERTLNIYQGGVYFRTSALPAHAKRRR